MARAAKPLTMAQVRKLPYGLHAVGGPSPGLLMLVDAQGGRRWQLRRFVDGTQRRFELDTLDALPTLEAARAAADAMRAQVSPGAKKPGPSVAADNPFLGPIVRALLELA